MNRREVSKQLTSKARRMTNGCYKVGVLDWLIRATGHLPNWLYGKAWLRGFLFALFMGAIFEGAAKARKEFKA